MVGVRQEMSQYCITVDTGKNLWVACSLADIYMKVGRLLS